MKKALATTKPIGLTGHQTKRLLSQVRRIVKPAPPTIAPRRQLSAASGERRLESSARKAQVAAPDRGQQATEVAP